jgi:hypothetical protein
MKIFTILLFVAALLLSGCSPAPKEGQPKAYDLWLDDGTITMFLLHKLDAGDIAVTKRAMMTQVLVTLDGLPDFAAQTHPTAEQKQEEIKLARDVLDYMLKHREDLDPRVRLGVRAMQNMLTEPDDVRRLKELSDYLAGAEKSLSEAHKP